MRLTYSVLSNYFKRYIEREVYQGRMRRQWHPLTGWKEMKKEDLYYDEHRPWTHEFKQRNAPGQNHWKIHVEPIKDWKIFKGDRVEILVGNDKGKQGVITSIIQERNWVFVEGLNCEYQKVQQNPEIAPVTMKQEKPLMVTTQVTLVDPGDKQPTEVEWRYTDEGDRVRVSVTSGRIIPVPVEARDPEDMILVKGYQETDKCTSESELTKVTFKAKLTTFEEDIMDSLGIKEDRKPAKTYWY